jgi:hypothetical protein
MPVIQNISSGIFMAHQYQLNGRKVLLLKFFYRSKQKNDYFRKRIPDIIRMLKNFSNFYYQITNCINYNHKSDGSCIFF